MSCGVAGRKARVKACYLVWRGSVFSNAADFERRLREKTVDFLYEFFGRRVNVDKNGRACYEVVIDFGGRRRLTGVTKAFSLVGDDAEVELCGYPGPGEFADVFVSRVVERMCSALCSEEEPSNLCVGGLHQSVGACRRDGRCVVTSRFCLNDVADADGDVEKVVREAEKELEPFVCDGIGRRVYSQETIRCAEELVEERVRLARIRLVKSLYGELECSGSSAVFFDQDLSTADMVTTGEFVDEDRSGEFVDEDRSGEFISMFDVSGFSPVNFGSDDEVEVGDI